MGIEGVLKLNLKKEGIEKESAKIEKKLISFYKLKR